MAKTKRIAVRIVAALAVAIPVYVLVVAPDLSWRPDVSSVLEHDQAMRVVTVITPRAHPFSGPIRAEIIVFADRDRIDPESIHVATDFAPYRVIGQQKESRDLVGTTVVVRVAATLQCLDAVACLPGGRTRTFRVALVRYRERGSAIERTQIASWPSVTPMSQLSDTDFQHPKLREGSPFPPEPSYRFPPSVVGWVLIALSVLGFSVALGMAVRALFGNAVQPPVQPIQPVASLSPLERAMDRVLRAAEGEDLEERRRSLEALAEALAAYDADALVSEAKRLAWSNLDPDVNAMRAIVQKSAAKALRGGA